MKFEEVLPALREGKKITCSIIKNSGDQYIYYKDGSVFNSKDDYWYITFKGVIDSDDWEIVEEPKKIKIKLRDLTEEQYKKWDAQNCGRIACRDCLFRRVVCDANSADFWCFNKDLFSDKFLDQEVEIYE